MTKAERITIKWQDYQQRAVASALTTMPEKKAALTKRMSKKRAKTEGKYGKWNGGAERDA